jgi:OOP family OmpA-OmpF porin
MSKLIVPLVLTGTLAAIPPANAENWYFGGYIGHSEATVPTQGIDDALLGMGFSSSQTVADDGSTAYKVTGGYEVNRFLDLEVGYAWLGNTKLRTLTQGPNGQIDLKADAEGFFAQALGRLPITDNSAALFKLGAFRWKVESTLRAEVPDFLSSAEKARETGSSFSYGVGFDYRIAERASLRFEYDRIDNVGDARSTGEADISVLSVGLLYWM